VPEHYGIGVNIVHGDVVFNASKTASVTFGMTFPTTPSISLTLDTEGSVAPPYKINASTTGFTIKFQTIFTGVVTWQALK